MMPDATTTNVAGDSAHIGVQAGTVHGDVSVYTTFADDPPERKCETGVRFLDGGIPGRAWQLINEAVMTGYRTDEACFHWLLALVSGRTRRELSEEEVGLLRAAPGRFQLADDNAWADGVQAVYRLLDSAEKPEADVRVMLEFDGLGHVQRAMILRHLELFLDGPLKDQMWYRAFTRAEQDQMAGDRTERVWKFFEPVPAGPRERKTRPPVIPASIWIQAVTATAVLTMAAAYIGHLLAREGRFSVLAAYALSVTGAYLGARDGVEWCFRTVRRHAKDREYGVPRQRGTGTPPGGFARGVDQRFDHYFAVYVPSGVDRATWLAATAGIRKSMRDEVVETYQEARVGVERISWLIRHRVGDVRKRWEKGTLWKYREELATPPSVKIVTILGLAALTGGGIWVVGDALLISPLDVSCSVVLVLMGGWGAARAWLSIVLERRRSAADAAESGRTLEEDRAAFVRWKVKLADKPEDREMAAWLDCDRKVLLNEALRHYKLSMSDVIAHAFIETRAGSAKRARVRGGPWRHLRYRIMVFLLTTDGVRQLTVELDFKQGTFHDRQRDNYRFEVIAAVRVSQSDDDERTFELALVNGQDIKVQVTGPGMEELQQGEAPGTVSEVTLDAAGLHHTLHVLEGIAAEGKGWIAQYRHGEPPDSVTAVMGGPAN